MADSTKFECGRCGWITHHKCGAKAPFDFLALRGVEEPCSRCSGLGCYLYSHGSTWQGGMGTAGGRIDICDLCWGTGDANRAGVDLRKLTSDRKDWESHQAAEWLAKRLGLRIGGMSAYVRRLSILAEKESRRRKIPEGYDTWFWARTWESLSNILLKLCEEFG